MGARTFSQRPFFIHTQLSSPPEGGDDPEASINLPRSRTISHARGLRTQNALFGKEGEDVGSWVLLEPIEEAR